MQLEFRVFVWLAGEMRYQLAVCSTAEAVGALVAALCRADKPGYGKVEIEIVPQGMGG